jgi:flagellar basal body P-ring formation protein FlgA
MYVLKQMLCRWILLLGLGLSCLLGSGQLTQALAKSKPERSPVAEASPEEALQRSVKKWVSEQQKTPVEALELAPLDSRLKLQACAVPMVFDTPFSSAETVRVRCSQPVWQLYVKVFNKSAPKALAPVNRESTVGKDVHRKVLVAAGVLPRGTVLNETHVVLADADTSNIGSPAFEAVADVMHSELVRDLRPGQPVRVQDVRQTVLVKRGQTVLLSVGQAQGFQITARVEALQDGRMGEKVQLKNSESGKILTGVVKGPNAVQGY